MGLVNNCQCIEALTELSGIYYYFNTEINHFETFKSYLKAYSHTVFFIDHQNHINIPN